MSNSVDTQAADSLEVHLQGELVGRLERLDGARLRFRYSPEWVSAAGRSLSLSLPLRTEPFDHEEAAPFFAGLLPEGEFLRSVARSFGVSASNAFSLLTDIGGECAGAVTLVPPGRQELDPESPYWISGPTLREFLRDLRSRPLHVGKDGRALRLSLAGAQDKVPVIFQGGSVGITHGAPPSTHIIKLADPRFERLAQNEAFCMELARDAGLNVARAHSRSAGAGFVDGPDDFYFLLVERYDRAEDETGSRRRLHQEDFCQALGYMPGEKYEAEGGPGVGECADLLADVSALPARDRLDFLDALIFNWIIGNHDAHCKNFSILLEGDGAPRLAPLYDLVCTRAYDLDRKMAMKLGGEPRPEYVRRRHLERLAADMGLSALGLRRRAVDLCRKVEAVMPPLLDRRRSDFHGSDVIDRIERQIREGLGQVRYACE